MKYAIESLIKKKQNLILIIIILNTLFIKRRSRSLLLKNEIITLNNKREMIILMNINNEKIFISQSFIKKTQISEFEYVLITMRIINDYQIFSYKKHDLIFDFINNREKKQKQILKIYIINMRKYDLILNFP